ncbi:MAG: response regulator [Deltaproteobacteria bacterium]|nr:response regulator [Deltaproteobacteria bacterium]
MKDQRKTKARLIEELEALRRRVAELESNEIHDSCGYLFNTNADLYRMLVEKMNDGIGVTDRAGTMIYVNDRVCEMLDYTPRQMIGRNIAEFLDDENRKILAGQLSPPAAGNYELTWTRKDGSELPTIISPKHIFNDDGEYRGGFAVVTDITERKRDEAERAVLEAQLQQAQKMEAIGRLAGGIAHDINNVLSAIMGSASALGMELSGGSLEADDVENILKACRKGSRLTRDLLGFARKGKYVKESICLNDSVKRIEDLLKHTISKKIAIRTTLFDELDYVEGDLSQIENVLLNVCINAADAMNDQGRLIMTTANTEIGVSAKDSISDLIPGKYVQVQLADTGTGMDSDTKARAFEPFFTTKPQGKGTGLGLAMVYGVVRNHGGMVTLDSELGKGTVVTIHLPAVERDGLAASSKGPAVVDSQTSGQGCVLLVDDEKIVRKSIQSMLARLGYKVIVAKNGGEAIDFFREEKKQIDLVFLDMAMPTIDGSETFAELKAIDPDVKVLLSSGYSKDDKVEKLLALGALGFMQKPFAVAELSKNLQSAIVDC